MSRIGQMPINVPKGVTVNITEEEVSVKGPKGELSRPVNRDMDIVLEGETMTVSPGQIVSLVSSALR